MANRLHLLTSIYNVTPRDIIPPVISNLIPTPANKLRLALSETKEAPAYMPIARIIESLAPVVAVGTPLVSNDPEKARAILNVASIVTAIPAIHTLLTKAVKATNVYKSLPEEVKDVYLRKTVPALTEHLIGGLMPVLMLQSAKLALPTSTQTEKKDA
ncbi:MAG: hypothetical protein ABIM30_00295 [candidate division WOR-3 bacterium]